LDFEDVLEVFDDPIQLREPNRLVGTETRLQVIGRAAPDLAVLFVVYTLREIAPEAFSTRIISVRPASRRERNRYGHP
jgi:uncharacterized DUF497 family protein